MHEILVQRSLPCRQSHTCALGLVVGLPRDCLPVSGPPQRASRDANLHVSPAILLTYQRRRCHLIGGHGDALSIGWHWWLLIVLVIRGIASWMESRRYVVRRSSHHVGRETVGKHAQSILASRWWLDEIAKRYVIYGYEGRRCRTRGEDAMQVGRLFRRRRTTRERVSARLF